MILYYWISGAPEDRMGGPWWHREFDSATERHLFLEDLKPFLHAYCESYDHTCENSCGRDTPPKEVQVIYTDACEMHVGFKVDADGDGPGDDIWCEEKYTHLYEGTKCCDGCAEKMREEGFTVTRVEENNA